VAVQVEEAEMKENMEEEADSERLVMTEKLERVSKKVKEEALQVQLTLQILLVVLVGVEALVTEMDNHVKEVELVVEVVLY
jgi:hypothetical protein